MKPRPRSRWHAGCCCSHLQFEPCPLCACVEVASPAAQLRLFRDQLLDLELLGPLGAALRRDSVPFRPLGDRLEDLERVIGVAPDALAAELRLPFGTAHWW